MWESSPFAGGKSDADIVGVSRKDFLRDSIRKFEDRNNEFAGESPSGKAAAFGAAIRRFESYLPSHNANDECWGLNYRVTNQINHSVNS